MFQEETLDECIAPAQPDALFYQQEPVAQTVRAHQQFVFSQAEYQRRLDGVYQAMQAQNLDIIIINDPANLCYLTGYETTGYGFLQPLILSLDAEPMIVTRYLESFNVYARTNLTNNRVFVDTDDPMDVLKNAIKELKLDHKTIAFEHCCAYLPRDFKYYLQAIHPGLDVKDCSGLVESLRITKSDEEIALMQQAAQSTVAAMQAGINACQVGIGEHEISAAVHQAMYASGSEYPAVSPYITSGPRCLIGHATWENRRVQQDECVFLELAACRKRYHVAMMRTLFMGKPPQAVLDAEAIVLEAIDTALDVLRPGERVCDADRKIRQVTTKIAKTKGKMVSRSGYSIGIAFAPSWDEGHILSLNANNESLLQENTTLHLIPWVHGILGKHVMAISETVQITPQGARPFCDLNRQLVLK